MQTNLTDFSGEIIYVGIDSHLKSWNVTIMSKEMELRNFTQEPDSGKLSAFYDEIIREPNAGVFMKQALPVSMHSEC